MKHGRSLLLACFLISAQPLLFLHTQAVQPQQAALLINQNDPDSMALANQYREWRDLPPENLFYLDLPPEATDAYATLSREVFDERVLRPMQKELKQRGLEQRILVWVYSAGFPVRIKAETTVSLQGYTLTRGILPDADWIQKGRAVTPLFSGVEGQGGDIELKPAIPFAAWRLALGTNMPLPSMMLSHLGTRGLTLAGAQDHVRKGVVADGTKPRGSVFFEQGKDVRARAREFQFEPAVKALRGMSIEAEMVTELPAKEPGILGVLAGRPMVFPSHLGTFRPGAFGDHLTSFAAIFHQYHQSKCTEWLRSGATATAGTVVEPMAIWTKFPTARFYQLYGKGLSMIEALYGSVACPFQTLMLGEPLCRPYGDREAMVIISLDDGALKGTRAFQAHFLSGADPNEFFWQYFLDGKSLGPPGLDHRVRVNTTRVSDGYHRLEAEAVHRTDPLLQGVARVELNIQNQGRSVSGVGPKEAVDVYHPVLIEVEADSDAVEVGVRVQGQLVAKREGASASLELHPKLWGVGPALWQACAVYPDGREVCSPPQRMVVEELNRAPAIDGLEVDRRSGKTVCSVQTADPEQDPVSVRWWQVLSENRMAADDVLEKMIRNGGLSTEKGEGWKYSIFDAEAVQNEVAASFIPYEELKGLAGGGRFGLVFNFKDEDNFSFFGYGGKIGTWVEADRKAGKWMVKRSLGRPVFRGTLYQLSIQKTEGGVLEASVNGRDTLLLTENGEETIGPWGVLTHDHVKIENVRVCLETGLELEIDPELQVDYEIDVEASDPFGASSRKRVKL